LVFKPVGVDENGQFPERVKTTLDATYIPPLMRTSTAPVADLPWVNALDIANVKRDDPTFDNGPGLSVAVQALSSAGGGTLVLPKGRYEIRTPINPQSNVTIHSGGGAVLGLAPDASNSIIRTLGSNYNNTLPTLVENFGISGLILDGGRHEGDLRSPGSWHTLYLKNIKKLVIENVTVRYPLAFGALIDWCDDVFVSNWQAESDQINQDGIHFFDCRNVGIKGLHGKAGDDLLGISAQFRDIRGYIVQDVQGTSVDGSVIRINQTDRSVAAGETRRLEDMWFFGVTGEDVGNKGFSINDVHSSSTVRNINLWANFKRTVRSGVDIIKAEDSFFHVTMDNCGTGVGITEFLTLHPFYAVTLIRSTVIATITGVTDGYNGVNISGGNTNDIQPKIMYPTSGFTNPQNCVFLGSVTDSVIHHGYTDGGGRAIQLGSSTLSTQRTAVRDMVIRNNSGFSIAEGTVSDNNVIENNYIRNGGVSKAGANTKVRRNSGVYLTESTGVATIASGTTSITVNHGLHTTPTAVIVTGRSSETADAYISSITSSQIQITVPVAVTAARDVMWRAEA
jgi:hypothetical protein